MKKLYVYLSSFLIIVSTFSCGTSTKPQQNSLEGSILDGEQSDVVHLLSKQVDSASNGFLEFKNFQKQASEYSRDHAKPYDYTLDFIASIVAKRDCYWNFPSNFLYDRRVLKQINLDVEEGVNPYKSNASFVKKGLGIPVEGTAYFNKVKGKLLIFDFTIKVHESVVSE